MKSKITLGLALIIMLLSGITLQQKVLAQCGGSAVDDIKCGANQASPAGGSPTVDDAIATTVNTLAIIIGVLAVLALMFGGYKYITSAGAPNKAASARSTILYALIGLVVALLAQVIVKFTIGKTLSL